MKLYRYSVIVLIILLLTACQPTPAPTLPAPTSTPAPTPTVTVLPSPTPTLGPCPDGVTTLLLWHTYTGAQWDVIEGMIETYNATNDACIRLEYAYVEGVGRALARAIPAGDGPDLVAWEGAQIGAAALAGTLAPLDAYLGSDFMEDTFVLPAARGMMWDGHVWGLPETMSGIALVYNRAMLPDEDLPDPDDFADLLAKATDFHDANNHLHYLCSPGLSTEVDATYAAPVYLGFGMPGVVGEDGRLYLDTQAALAAGEWIAAFSRVSPVEASAEQCREMMRNGEVAAWWTGPESMAGLTEDGVYHDIAPLGRPLVETRAWMLTANAVERGNAEAAVAAMTWWTSQAVLTERVLRTGEIPANAAALANRDVQSDYVISGFGEALSRGVPVPNTPYADAVWGPLGDATAAIWSGAQTPAEALAAAQAAATAAIAEMK
ncbi:MAG: extracellular solute-binding protein [Anaerolineae bacterium]|nr:extracellular solute-binding protein [Anaerolineae bacterium]